MPQSTARSSPRIHDSCELDPFQRHVGRNLPSLWDLIKPSEGRARLTSCGPEHQSAVTSPRLSRHGRHDLQRSSVTRVKAMNEHWRGVLRLSSLDRTVVLEGPGAERTVRAAIVPWFEELPRSGENLIFRRRSS